MGTFLLKKYTMPRIIMQAFRRRRGSIFDKFSEGGCLLRGKVVS